LSKARSVTTLNKSRYSDVKNALAAAILCVGVLLGCQSESREKEASRDDAAGDNQPPLMSGREAAKVGGFKKVTVVPGLENPWGLVFLPDGDMLITERPGRLRLVRDGQLVDQPIEGVPQVLALNQGGLMGIALHPDFARNRYVYLTYSTGTPQANRTTLARGTFDGSRLNDVRVLFQAQPDKPDGQHFGSCILWLPDRTMLVSIGDGGNPPVMVEGILARENGQRLDRHLGKILRLDAEGKAPKDNPFVGREGAKPEVYTYGNRNIQGLALDPRSGRVWATEHGPFGGDELNLVRKGGNY
jgi:glucose/arabinose dehydrogenase